MYGGVQYLRGIAASAIVLKHASHPGGTLQIMLDAGVDLFFVISGFVMVVSTHGRNMSPQEFLGKRCRRILPMWWLTLCLVVALGLGKSGSLEWLMSFLFLPHATTDAGVPHLFWGVGWTLVFEAIFYAFFAAGLALKSERFIFWLLPALVTIGLVFGRGDNPLLNAMLHPLLLEFMLGAFIAKLVLSGARPSPYWAVAGLVALWAGGFSFGHDQEMRPLAFGLPMAMVLAAIAARDNLPESKTLRTLGDASYSLYLLHYVPIMLAWQFIEPDSYWPLTAAAAFAVGILAYRYVEKPMLDALRRPRFKSLPAA